LNPTQGIKDQVSLKKINVFLLAKILLLELFKRDVLISKSNVSIGKFGILLNDIRIDSIFGFLA